MLSSIRGNAAGVLRRPGKATWLHCAARPARVWIDELAFLVGCGRKPDDAKAFLDAAECCAECDSGSLMRALLALGRGQARRGGSFESLVAVDLVAAGGEEAAGGGGADSLRRRRAVDDRLAAIRLLGLGDPKTAPQCASGAARRSRSRRPFNCRSLAGDGGLPGPICCRRDSYAVEGDEPVGAPGGGRGALQSRPRGSRRCWQRLSRARLRHRRLTWLDCGSLETHANPDFRSRARRFWRQERCRRGIERQVVAAYRPAIELAGEPRARRRGFRQGLCDVPSGRGAWDRRWSEPGDGQRIGLRKNFSCTSWTRTARWRRTS